MCSRLQVEREKKIMLSTQRLSRNRGGRDRMVHRRRPHGKKGLLWCAQVVYKGKAGIEQCGQEEWGGNIGVE